ncbi:MAG: alpha-amylase family glycosyl hydrolase, partial [Defluviitaleaceae bacterium]|nr:alpha-amylase family glycosyl hydrolase [Defluviitaleaceae bacterium]
TAVCLAFALSACAGEGHRANTDKYRNFYEIFVGGFYDSTGNGMGDLNGVTHCLDYLNDGTKNSLGIDGIWLMPVMPSPTYHKYDVINYMDIDPLYGTLDDFERLIAECGKRGIAVIIDLVLNHTSTKHPWFMSATASLSVPGCGENICAVEILCAEHNPYIGYYNFTNEKGVLPDFFILANGWQYQAVFWDQMPDLNLDDEKLKEEIVEITRFWLDMGVAGFRLDAVIEFFDKNAAKNIEFLQWFCGMAQSIDPNVYVVCEAWADAGTIERYYESGADSFFNFPFSNPSGEIVAALRSGNGSGFAQKIVDWDKRIKNKNPSAIDAPFLSNHDNSRSAGFLMNNLTHQKMCAAMYLFMPGVPFIYYGEEIGMTGSGRDENKRQPMIWSANDKTGRPYPPSGADQQQSLTAGFKEQLKDKNSLLRFYIDAIMLKNKHPEIARGTPAAVDLGSRALSAHVSSLNGSSVLIVHNLAGEAAAWSLDILPGEYKLQGFLTADGGSVRIRNNDVQMPPYSTAVFKE